MPWSDGDFEICQDLLDLLPNQARNLVDGLLALDNQGRVSASSGRSTLTSPLV